MLLKLGAPWARPRKLDWLHSFLRPIAWAPSSHMTAGARPSCMSDWVHTGAERVGQLQPASNVAGWPALLQSWRRPACTICIYQRKPGGRWAQARPKTWPLAGFLRWPAGYGIVGSHAGPHIPDASHGSGLQCACEHVWDLQSCGGLGSQHCSEPRSATARPQAPLDTTRRSGPQGAVLSMWGMQGMGRRVPAGACSAAILTKLTAAHQFRCLL